MQGGRERKRPFVHMEFDETAISSIIISSSSSSTVCCHHFYAFPTGPRSPQERERERETCADRALAVGRKSWTTGEASTAYACMCASHHRRLIVHLPVFWIVFRETYPRRLVALVYIFFVFCFFFFFLRAAGCEQATLERRRRGRARARGNKGLAIADLLLLLSFIVDTTITLFL